MQQQLQEAVERGQYNIVKLLIEKGADIHIHNDHLFLDAARAGHFNIVKLLLDNGANVHTSNNMAISYAAEKGNLDLVKLLIEKGANIDDNTFIASVVGDGIKIYYNRGKLNIVKFLLENGADLCENDNQEANLKPEINDKKQFIWQELCFQLNKEGTEMLLGFAKLLDIPVNNDLITKRQLCLLLSEKMYESVLN
jgi:ankyrin repeat protein